MNCKTFEFGENLCFLSQSKHSKHTQHVIFQAVDSWGELTEETHHADVIEVAPPKDFHRPSKESQQLQLWESLYLWYSSWIKILHEWCEKREQPKKRRPWQPGCWPQLHLFESIAWKLNESKRFDPESWTAKGTAKMMGLQKWNYFQGKTVRLEWLNSLNFEKSKGSFLQR